MELWSVGGREIVFGAIFRFFPISFYISTKSRCENGVMPELIV